MVHAAASRRGFGSGLPPGLQIRVGPSDGLRWVRLPSSSASASSISVCPRRSTSIRSQYTQHLFWARRLDTSAEVKWQRSCKYGHKHGLRRTILARTLHRLSAVGVNTTGAPGYYADGGGLYLRVAPGRTRAWIFRFTLGGKKR